jgi:hypothetical protein
VVLSARFAFGGEPNGRGVDVSIVRLVREEPADWGFITLTGASGTGTVRAKPLGLTDGKVRLEMRNGRVATVALSKFTKADQDLLSEGFPHPAKGDDGAPTGAEFLKEALIRAHETSPNETQVRREILIKERKEEFHKKYDHCKLDLRFNIRDVSGSTNGYFLWLDRLDARERAVGGAIPPSGRLLYDITPAYSFGGEKRDQGLLANLTAEDAKTILRGDKLHITGSVQFSEVGGKNALLFSYQGLGGGTFFYFEKPTITIEETRSSSRLKDAVAAKLAELRKLEAAGARPKNDGNLVQGDREAQAPRKGAKVVGEGPPPVPAAKLGDPSRRPEPYRVWADANGHRVEAAFVQHTGPDVTLRKRDGTEITVPISTFSRDDLEWMLKEGK